MSRNLSYQQTSEDLEARNEPVAFPRLVAFGYFGAMLIATIGWLAFIAWILWKLIDWAFA
jgi:nitrate reductase NapE component